MQIIITSRGHEVSRVIYNHRKSTITKAPTFEVEAEEVREKVLTVIIHTAKQLIEKGVTEKVEIHTLNSVANGVGAIFNSRKELFESNITDNNQVLTKAFENFEMSQDEFALWAELLEILDSNTNIRIGKLPSLKKVTEDKNSKSVFKKNYANAVDLAWSLLPIYNNVVIIDEESGELDDIEEDQIDSETKKLLG